MTVEMLADFQLLAEELDEDCARELAACFLEDGASELASVDAAIAEKNFDDVRRHAHGLKGCCRTIKAPIAEEAASVLEFAAIDKDWDKVSDLRSAFQIEYDKLVLFVREYLG